MRFDWDPAKNEANIRKHPVAAVGRADVGLGGDRLIGVCSPTARRMRRFDQGCCAPWASTWTL